jgi:hypothetical protein
MDKRTILRMAWMLTLSGIAGIALAGRLAAQDQLNFSGTVTAVREAPAVDPLPGLHIDVKVQGRTMDVYLAPMFFVKNFDVKVAKGDEVRITGSQTKSGNKEIVLAREMTTGFTDARTGRFHPNLTVYLRNDDGPMWVDEAKPVTAH